MKIEYVKPGSDKMTVVSGSMKSVNRAMDGVSANIMNITFATNSVEDVDKAIKFLNSIKICHVLTKSL